MLSRTAALARLFTGLLAFAAAAELVVARGMLFVRHERARAGLPAPGEWWWRIGGYLTTFTGLLAVAAVVTLGLRLVASRFPSAGRGLGLGFAATIGALGVTALFVPPDVRGILTIHLAVVLGGTTLGIAVLLLPRPWEVKAVATLPLLLPPLGTAALALQGPSQTILRTALAAAGTLVAVVLAVAAARRASRTPRSLRLIAVVHALAVGCVAASAALLQPRRALEFVLFSHGLLLDFRGALALIAVVVLCVAFATAALVLEPAGERAPGSGDGRLLGLGVLLSFLAGPCPLNATQSLLLAAGGLALVIGALDPASLRLPDEDRTSSPPE